MDTDAELLLDPDTRVLDEERFSELRVRDDKLRAKRARLVASATSSRGDLLREESCEQLLGSSSPAHQPERAG